MKNLKSWFHIRIKDFLPKTGALILLGLMITAHVQDGLSQRFFTRNGKISFTSEAPLEKIYAVNNGVNCVLEVSSGKIEAAALVKAFQFEKALMQQHFNENYMESGKYPKAIFKGQISNMGTLDLTSNGEHTVQLDGEITIHGVTRPLKMQGVIQSGQDRMKAQATFILKPEDFEIKIPSLVRDNIAKEIEVAVEFDLEPFGKS